MIIVDFIIHSYKEIILSITMWIWEAFFSVGWGVGMIYRWLLWVLDYPFAVGVWSLSVYGFVVRIIGIVMYRNAGLIKWDKALAFLPVSLIWWYFGSQFVLSASNTYIYLIMWIYLLMAWYLHFFPVQFTLSIESYRINNKKVRYTLWYIIMIITDVFTTVVGWAGIITTHLLKYFFDIGTLESAGMRKVFMMGRSVTVLSAYYLAGTYDTKLIMMLLILGIPCFIMWTKFVIRKWDSFAEHIIGYMSLFFGIFMLYKGLSAIL